MNQNELQLWAEKDVDSIDFESLEKRLESELEEQFDDLKGLELDHEKIGSPDSIGETIKNVVWEQILNEIGASAGEDFIKENRGLTLDLRDDAHIQTTENFSKGKIATHNTQIDYQQRYDDWQSNFQRNDDGSVVTHTTRTGQEEATLVSGARAVFDKGRPTGSMEKGTDMDHIISAGEIIRSPEANAHMTREEQITFANSDINLHEMDSSQNRSKGDKPMTVWLDNPNKKGQRPNEIYDISDAQDKKYREKDSQARAEFDKKKKEAEQRSIEAGRKSQREEAFKIGGAALRAAIMGLLAKLIKDIIRKLISWFRSGSRKLSTFIESIKQAIKSFLFNIKENLLTAGNTMLTTIATAIFGPIIGMLKKAWIFLKQGYKSVTQAVKFLKDPANKNMPFSLKMMEVGKIVIAGLSAGGAIILGEVIEKSLMSIPIFAFPIPILGSLANLLGMFFGALVSGLIGALALNLIDRLIAKKLKKINESQQIEKRNDILSVQDKLIWVVENKVESARDETFNRIQQRHSEAFGSVLSSIEVIKMNSEAIDAPLAENAEIIEDNASYRSENKGSLDQLFADLNEME
ncbi:hypothetical protein IX335_000823 [Porphyromonas levii]|uniref:DMT family transporter n=1 Tax=Porphyromonas levii TaxID=28114 RepID=UPI001BA93F54|nr:DMT family transporter [Porphyromonas levii]MBR8763608.1 hypothetical protein [Porphyromonas levii]